jgi:hypothetical protein
MNKGLAFIACLLMLFVAAALHLDARLEQNRLVDGANTADAALANKIEDIARVAVTREQLRGDRVIRLPEDGGAWFLSVWYDDKSNSPASRHLAGMIAGTPRLAALAAQTHFNEHQAAKPDWVFTHRYAREPRPGIVLQDALGKVVFKAAGGQIPADGEQLADSIADAVNLITQCGPDGCPTPRPGLRPQPPADEGSGRRFDRPLIQRRETNEPSDGEKAAGLLALAAVVVLLIVVLTKGKRK